MVWNSGPTIIKTSTIVIQARYMITSHFFVLKKVFMVLYLKSKINVAIL